MDKESILELIKEIREKEKKRNFVQTFDLIINLRNIDIKNPEEKIDMFIQLPHGKGKKNKICALVDIDLLSEAKDTCDKVIQKNEFPRFKGKRELKKLAKEYDFFIGEATIMPQIAATFGKVFGPLGKMPNPKAGCVVPPKAPLKQICERLRNTVRLITKNEATIKVPVGNEAMKDEEIAENIITVYNSIVGKLPQEKANIKNMLLKLTMGKPYQIKNGKT